MIGPLAANTAKTLRRTTTGYGSGSDFEAGTSFMATLEPQSGWEKGTKKGKSEEGKGKESEGEQSNQTKATIKSPKAKATSKLKTKAAEKSEGSTKNRFIPKEEVDGKKSKDAEENAPNYAYQSHYQWLQGKQTEESSRTFVTY